MFKLTGSSGDLFPDRQPPRELAQGSCRGHADPTIFFSDDPGQARQALKTRQARLVCAGCPVREVCQRYALDAQEPYGVWGGLNRHDRAFVLGARAKQLTGSTGRPIRNYGVPCDTPTCSDLVPLGLVGANLTPDGHRYCDACFAEMKVKASAA